MSINKILLTIAAGAGITYLTSGFEINDSETVYNTTAEVKFGNANEPGHMVGCRTFDPPVAPKIVYPTVSQNFRTLLCALEVPPPPGVLILDRKNRSSD